MLMIFYSTPIKSMYNNIFVSKWFYARQSWEQLMNLLSILRMSIHQLAHPLDKMAAILAADIFK